MPGTKRQGPQLRVLGLLSLLGLGAVAEVLHMPRGRTEPALEHWEPRLLVSLWPDVGCGTRQLGLKSSGPGLGRGQPGAVYGWARTSVAYPGRGLVFSPGPYDPTRTTEPREKERSTGLSLGAD